MFGAIVSGRPVLAEPQTLSPTDVAFTIPAQPSFSHIVVFLVPGAALPPDTLGAVYVQLPGQATFKLLGAVGLEKQSAIFRVHLGAGVAAGGGSNEVGLDEDAMVDEAEPVHGPGPTVPNVMLGISLEPAAQVAANLAQLKLSGDAAAAPATPAAAPLLSGAGAAPAASTEAVPGAVPVVATRILAQRIIKNAYDFLASFGSDVVPLRSFQAWWEKFEKKIELDPGFLERSDGG